MLILLGKKRTLSNPTVVGGAIILFEQLIYDLGENGKQFKVIDLNYRNYPNKVRAFLSIYNQILTTARKDDVLFYNGSNNGILLYGIPLFICKILFNTKIAIRLFGGDFRSYYHKRFFLLRKFIKFFFKQASIIFFEQKYQVNYFSKWNKNTNWFPNMRSRITETEGNNETTRKFSGRFVFVGHIRNEKGINEILRVKNELKEYINIDLYGPIVNYKPPVELSDIFESIYKGPLEQNQVTKVLSEYDVLVLPSYKEGYPGVIIEALSVGLPIIATSLPGIREMMEGVNCCFFIEPRNVYQLKEALVNFDDRNYQVLSDNAFRLFSKYDSKIQIPKIIQQLDSL